MERAAAAMAAALLLLAPEPSTLAAVVVVAGTLVLALQAVLGLSFFFSDKDYSWLTSRK